MLKQREYSIVALLFLLINSSTFGFCIDKEKGCRPGNQNKIETIEPENVDTGNGTNNNDEEIQDQKGLGK